MQTDVPLDIGESSEEDGALSVDFRTETCSCGHTALTEIDYAVYTHLNGCDGCARSLIPPDVHVTQLYAYQYQEGASEPELSLYAVLCPACVAMYIRECPKDPGCLHFSIPNIDQ